ncbi:hypothetical protein DA075_04590 [Methylobacterium currus]|uniref:Uncharacterized protein n=1 Tax=Methylobacterium currus TaxID=2051553 RepID=A0A2R4WFJ6_9HYPH|nr:hypothetical protein DA075_04590 [Methylobacterium currus]
MKSDASQRSDVQIAARDPETVEIITLPLDQTSSVAATALPVDHNALVAHAVDAVKQYTGLDSRAAEQVDAQGQEAIRRMLIVRESFEIDGQFDWVSFNAYADNQRGRLKTPPKNPLQRLARVCCPPTTKRPQVSKFGYVLAALDQRGITSATVMAEFRKREPVKDGGPDHGGMERFVRLFKLDMKEEAGKSGESNPYERYTDIRLIKHAKFLIEALRAREMLRDGVVDVEGILTEEAVIKLFSSENQEP